MAIYTQVWCSKLLYLLAARQVLKHYQLLQLIDMLSRITDFKLSNAEAKVKWSKSDSDYSFVSV